MAVRIRLRRIGKKKQPQYRLVAADSAAARDGRFLEVIGHYNPRVDPRAVSVNEDRVLWWLKQGAQPSDTARSLLVRAGVWAKFTGESLPAETEAPVIEGAAEPEQPEPGPAEEAEEAAEPGPAEQAEKAAEPEPGPTEETEETAAPQ